MSTTTTCQHSFRPGEVRCLTCPAHRVECDCSQCAPAEPEPDLSKLPNYCPAWCDGRADHHAAWFTEILEPAPVEHAWHGGNSFLPELPHRARGNSYQIRVEQAPDRWPMVQAFLSNLSGNQIDFPLTSGEARSLAAALTEAADVIDLRGNRR